MPTLAAPCGCNRRPNRSRYVRLLHLKHLDRRASLEFPLPNLRSFPQLRDGPSTQELRHLDKEGALQTRSVRGTFVMNTFDSVCERYSPAAHAMVLQLPPSAADLAERGARDL